MYNKQALIFMLAFFTLHIHASSDDRTVLVFRQWNTHNKEDNLPQNPTMHSSEGEYYDILEDLENMKYHTTAGPVYKLRLEYNGLGMLGQSITWTQKNNPFTSEESGFDLQSLWVYESDVRDFQTVVKKSFKGLVKGGVNEKLNGDGSDGQKYRIGNKRMPELPGSVVYPNGGFCRGLSLYAITNQHKKLKDQMYELQGQNIALKEELKRFTQKVQNLQTAQCTLVQEIQTAKEEKQKFEKAQEGISSRARQYAEEERIMKEQKVKEECETWSQELSRKKNEKQHLERESLVIGNDIAAKESLIEKEEREIEEIEKKLTKEIERRRIFRSILKKIRDRNGSDWFPDFYDGPTTHSRDEGSVAQYCFAPRSALKNQVDDFIRQYLDHIEEGRALILAQQRKSEHYASISDKREDSRALQIDLLNTESRIKELQRLMRMNGCNNSVSTNSTYSSSPRVFSISQSSDINISAEEPEDVYNMDW